MRGTLEIHYVGKQAAFYRQSVYFFPFLDCFSDGGVVVANAADDLVSRIVGVSKRALADESR